MPNLDNSLKGFFIDGKPVKKASLDGKIFFEKHDYNLDVSASESIIQIDDSTTITACLTDYNEPVEGETVVFECDELMNIQTKSSQLGEKWEILSDSNIMDILGYDNNNHYIDIYVLNNTVNIIDMTDSFSRIFTDSKLSNSIVSYENGMLYYYDSSNTQKTYNIPLSEMQFESGDSHSVKSNLLSSITDSSGECSVGYVGKGTGDLNIKCEVPERSLVSEIYVEDIYYANLEEHINTGGYETLTSNITNLPTNFELTVDLFTTEGVQGYEQRLYLCASDTFTGNAQPGQGVWVGFNRPNYGEYGYRDNASNWYISYIQNMTNQYHSFKIIRHENTWEFYMDNSLKGTKSYSNLSNYNNFTLCSANWNNGSTFKIKNIKIKELN